MLETKEAPAVTVVVRVVVRVVVDVRRRGDICDEGDGDSDHVDGGAVALTSTRQFSPISTTPTLHCPKHS